MKTEPAVLGVKIDNTNVGCHGGKYLMWIWRLKFMVNEGMGVGDCSVNQLMELGRDVGGLCSVARAVVSVVTGERIPVFAEAHHLQMQFCAFLLIPIPRLVEPSGTHPQLPASFYYLHLPIPRTMEHTSMHEGTVN